MKRARKQPVILGRHLEMTINVVLMQRLQPRFAVLAEVRFIHVSYTWWGPLRQTHYELLESESP